MIPKQLQRAVIGLGAAGLSLLAALSVGSGSALAADPTASPLGVLISPSGVNAGTGGCYAAPGTPCVNIDVYLAGSPPVLKPELVGGVIGNPNASKRLLRWTAVFDAGTVAADGSAPIIVPHGAKALSRVDYSASVEGATVNSSRTYQADLPLDQAARFGGLTPAGSWGPPGLPTAGLTLAALAAAVTGLLGARVGAAAGAGAKGAPAKPEPKIVIAPKAGDQMGPELTFPDTNEDGLAPPSPPENADAPATPVTAKSAAGSTDDGTIDISDRVYKVPDLPPDPNDPLSKAIHDGDGSATTEPPVRAPEADGSQTVASPDSSSGLGPGDRVIAMGMDGNGNEQMTVQRPDGSTYVLGRSAGQGGAASPPPEPSAPAQPPDVSAVDTNKPIQDGLEPPKPDDMSQGILKTYLPPDGFQRDWGAGWGDHHAFNPDTGQVARYDESDGRWVVSDLPKGFAPADNPAFAQNPATGAVAHYDPGTNQWTVQQPPPGFEQDTRPDGSLGYVNPSTGRSIHFGGQDWVDDSTGGPVTHSYDPATGRTAYLDPNSQAWVVHEPPPGYQVDKSVPDDEIGYHFVSPAGDRVTYDVHSQQWVDEKTGQPVAPMTVERPNTGDAAGRVEVHDDPEFAQAGQSPLPPDSVTVERLEALQHGDMSVPHGDPGQWLLELQDKMSQLKQQEADLVKNGYTQTGSYDELAHNRAMQDDLQERIEILTTKGSAALEKHDEAADFDAQSRILLKVVEIGTQAAGTQGAQSIEGSFAHLDAAPTGLHGNAGEGAPEASPAQHTIEHDTVDEATADTVKGAGADTRPLPPEEQPAIDPDRTPRLPRGAHDGQTSVENPVDGGADQQRAQAAQNVARKYGMDDVDQLGAQIRHQQLQAQIERSLRDGDTAYGVPRPGESIEQAADRLAQVQGLPETHRPEFIETNMLAAQRQLEQVVGGKAADIGVTPTPDTVSILYDQYAKQVLNLRQAVAEHGDNYFNLTDAKTAATLRQALERPTTLQSWLDRLPPK